MSPASPSESPAAESAAPVVEAPSTLAARVLAGARELHPAYFALVMATGIISNACHLLGFRLIALALLWLNVVFYLSLWIMTSIRLRCFTSSFVADLRDHNRGVGFFTMIAGTCVLGSQCQIILARPEIAAGLWVIGLLLWVLLTYTVFTNLTIKHSKPELARGINGGWLVAVVGTQAVSLLGGQVSHYLEPSQQGVLFVSLIFWLGGGMLYVWIISLIFYRYTFFALEPSDLAPPYWINMGAMAISTLAGTVLIDQSPASPLLESLAPFLSGVTLLFWATATWWIPMLIILGVWRHGYRRFPLRYDPLYWGAVFPLGMYTVCTDRLIQVLPLEFLAPLPRAFIYIALGAWALTFCGLIGMLARLVRGPRGNA